MAAGEDGRIIPELCSFTPDVRPLQPAQRHPLPSRQEGNTRATRRTARDPRLRDLTICRTFSCSSCSTLTKMVPARNEETRSGCPTSQQYLNSPPSTWRNQNPLSKSQYPHQERGKRSADSLDLYLTKQPPVKTHTGAGTCSSTACSPDTQSLAAFPTTDNPASEHSLKAMLLTLQAHLQCGLSISINQLHDKVNSLEERTDHIERHLCDATKAHNAIVDMQYDQAATIHMLHLKVADLEDHSRRNNVKVRGVPESLHTSENVPYLHQWYRKLIPSLTTNDMLIDRAHRIHKPQHLPASLSHTKDNIMRVARSLRSLPAPFAKILRYNDILAATSQVRKSFAPVTSLLIEHKITYIWGYPTKLLVTHQNQQVPIMTPKDGLKKLHNWGIISHMPPPTPKPNPSSEISSPWESCIPL